MADEKEKIEIGSLLPLYEIDHGFDSSSKSYTHMQLLGSEDFITVYHCSETSNQLFFDRA